MVLDRDPDLYFRLFHGDKEIYNTEDTIIWNLTEPKKTVTIAFNAPRELLVEKPQPKKLPLPPKSDPVKPLPPISNKLQEHLESLNIHSLEDIRLRGGLAHLPNPPDAVDVKRLEALAYLDLLSDDITETEKLADSGFSGPWDLAHLSQSSFVRKSGLDEARARDLHHVAKAQEMILGEIDLADRLGYRSPLKVYTIHGRIINVSGKNPSPSLRVEIWFGAERLFDVSSRNGRFTILLTDPETIKKFETQQHQFDFRVFHLETKLTVVKTNITPQLEVGKIYVGLEVHATPGEEPQPVQPFRVYGQVRSSQFANEGSYEVRIFGGESDDSLYVILTNTIGEFDEIIDDPRKINLLYQYAQANQLMLKVFQQDQELEILGQPTVQPDLDNRQLYLSIKVVLPLTEVEHSGATAISLQAYLVDLTNYALTHLQKDGEDLSGVEELDELFYYPFSELEIFSEEAEELIPQIRIACEVLQRYWEKNKAQLDGQQRDDLERTLNEKRRETLDTAYENILVQIGTSRDELRLARWIDPNDKGQKAEREALANRLGFQLDEPAENQTDRLQQLYLRPQLPDLEMAQKLQELFGLPAIGFNEFFNGQPPLLQQWQEEYLEQIWARQDRQEETTKWEDPVIDPDLISPADFRDQNNSAFTVWQTRRIQIDALVSQLFDLSQTRTLPELLTESGLEIDFSTEQDEVSIAELGLKQDGYNRLKEIVGSYETSRSLALEERNDVVSILVQAKKRRELRKSWKIEEKDAGIFLDAELFWVSLAEPKVGSWPPIEEPAISPSIDPDFVGE